MTLSLHVEPWRGSYFDFERYLDFERSTGLLCEPQLGHWRAVISHAPLIPNCRLSSLNHARHQVSRGGFLWSHVIGPSAQSRAVFLQVPFYEPITDRRLRKFFPAATPDTTRKSMYALSRCARTINFGCILFISSLQQELAK